MPHRSELYVVTIQLDGRGVTGFAFTKAAASVPASVMCTVQGRYLFLGSAVADSMLLQVRARREMNP